MFGLRVRRLARLLIVPALGATLAACATSARVAYSEDEARAAIVGGNPQVRTFADVPDRQFLANTQGARTALARRGQPTTYLALSGGGGDGAYGAGVLNGWTESGRRPVFSVVSGVSTGALIAPFAFLGSAYDPVVKEVYTSGIAESLLERPDLVNAIFGASLFSNDRLRQLVERYVTPEIVAEIAAARGRNRFLFVVTTNLDQQRPVLWDMGAIAQGGTPESLALFRSVLVASASIPAVFPPVLIDAAAGGRTHGELHVDGTVTTTVFTLPRIYLSGRTPLGRLPGGTLYVLMNSKLEHDFQVVENKAATIGGRTFSTFVKDKARADLSLAERVARGSGIDFKLTYIGRDVPTSNGVGFETEYMRRLYQYGYEQARGGAFWRETIPDEAVMARREAARR